MSEDTAEDLPEWLARARKHLENVRAVAMQEERELCARDVEAMLARVDALELDARKDQRENEALMFAGLAGGLARLAARMRAGEHEAKP